MSPTAVAIIGASGYTGAELIRLLLAHPHVRITGLFAHRNAGEAIDDIFQQFRGHLSMPLQPLSLDGVAAVAEVAFCALPHGQSAAVAAGLLERGLAVIDLSADFRLRNKADYAAWYGTPDLPEHPAPDLLSKAVYGLPERYREHIKSARLVACPGCYPTAAILAIAPLIERGLVAADSLIIDAKSGASGAGRSPSQATHLPEAGEGVRAYKIAGSHRHTGEMEQEITALCGHDVALMFTPHLLPMSRGILSCVYATPTNSECEAAVYRGALVEAYDREPFMVVLPEGRLPDTAQVRASNFAHIAVAYDRRARKVLALAAIDNLVKGAAGQAVQCLNLMRGYDETTGLMAMPVFP